MTDILSKYDEEDETLNGRRTADSLKAWVEKLNI